VLSVALSTLRARRASFAGATVALALSVALVYASGALLAGALSQSGAGRFARARAVVAAAATMTVGRGETASVVTVHPPPRIPESVVALVRSVPGVGLAVGDIAFPAVAFKPNGQPLAAPGADRAEGHGWSSAALTPYRLLAGRPPAGGQVVIDSRLGPGIAIGTMLRVVTPGGTYGMRVSGIAQAATSATIGQSALFFADRTAARLAATPAEVNAIAVLAGPVVPTSALQARLRRRLGAGYVIYSRDDAADADAGDPRAQQREDLTGYLGTLGATAAVVALFIVATTFTLTTLQRRHELALLRVIGATPLQIQILLAREALAIGALGGVIGCAGGIALTESLANALIRHGVAPLGLRSSISWVAALIALGSGLVIAVMAALAAAIRPSRLPPAEALREATMEGRPLGLSRWLLGAAALAGGVTMTIVFKGDLALDFAEVTAILLAIAAALLGPLVLGLPATALSLPLRMTGSGLLASAAIANDRRRVGAMGAPLVLIVALAASFATSDATSKAATASASAARVRAALIAVPANGAGFPLNAAASLRAVPGVRAALGTINLDVYLVDSGLDNFGSPWSGVAVDGPIGTVLNLGVRSGFLRGVQGDRVAVSAELASHRDLRVGSIIHARFADLDRADLRVVAIYDHALGFGDILVARSLGLEHAAVRLENAVYIDSSGAISPQSVRRALPNATLLTRTRDLQQLKQASGTASWPEWMLIGVLVALAAIASVNASVMALTERRRELLLVRGIGATAKQIRRQIAWETTTITFVSLCIGTLSAAIAVLRIGQRPGWHLVMPTTQLLLILAGTAILGLASTFVPARLLLRFSPRVNG
jgi:putative ABC transport system permease protein